MKLLRILLLLSAILLTDKLSAQKVGLVLSGGGAKGLAHIGVIKALEENGIPIDCIAGTSIGAIVGGLYAIGYSPNDMIELFSSKEFHTWYTGAKEEMFANYSQKLNPSADVLYLRFDVKKGNFKMQLPTNFVSTYQMDLAFLQLFAAPNAAANEDFNQLFVPFRCVATDINHKRSYVAKDGDLGTAIRASMTFPLYFKPVLVDSLLLFDGGMYNNFPQDVMVREFNPDYIIGSKCAGNSLKADEEDLFLQLENMVMQTTDYDVSHDCGVLIESKFEDVSLLDFNRVSEFVDSGYYNTLKLIDSIKQRVPANADREEVGRRREQYKKGIPPLVFKDVNVAGQTNPHRINYIKTIFSGRKQKPFDFNELKDRYFKMVGSETVSTLYPTASKDSTSSFFDINLRVVPASRFKVSIGGNISSSNAQEGYVGLEYKYWKRALTTATANLYYGRLYSSGMIGARQDLPTPHTIFYELYGIYNRYDYYSGSPEIFLATNKPSYLKQNDYQFRTGIGVALDNNTPLRLTLTEGNSIGEYYQTVDFAINDVPDKSKIDYINYSLTAERNTLNHTQFPTKGRRLYASARYIGTEETYTPGTTSSLARCEATPSKVWAARVSGEHYYTIGKRLSLGYMFDAVYSRKSDFSNYLSTVLMAPAFQPTIHSKTIFIPEFRSNAYLGAGFMPTFFLTDKLFLKSGIYTFMPYQEIVRNPNNSTSYGDPVDKLLWSGSASAVWNSPLGPLSISMNYYDKQDNRVYFVFNFGFILFNRSGIEY